MSWEAVFTVPLVVVAVLVLLVRLFLFKKGPKVGLSPVEYRKFRLASKTNVSHNTRRFRFALQTPKTKLGLPIGKHLSIRSKFAEGLQMRSYTPTSSDDDLGYFELVVKIYPDGKMTQYLDHLSIGDHIEVCGPRGRLEYLGYGEFVIDGVGPKAKKQSKKVTSVAMIAGGTGITPMLQIIQAILKNPKDRTQISLIFGNISEDDILLREELETLQEKHSNFKLHLVLDKPPVGWTQGSGYVTTDMMSKQLPLSDKPLLLFCGPPPMIGALKKNCAALEIPEESYFSF